MSIHKQNDEIWTAQYANVRNTHAQYLIHCANSAYIFLFRMSFLLKFYFHCHCVRNTFRLSLISHWIQTEWQSQKIQNKSHPIASCARRKTLLRLDLSDWDKQSENLILTVFIETFAKLRSIFWRARWHTCQQKSYFIHLRWEKEAINCKTALQWHCNELYGKSECIRHSFWIGKQEKK